MNVENRSLYIADNLDIMRGIDSETIDLIYLDPPFNTKKNYKAPIGSPAEGASFKDIWTDEDIKDEWHGEIAEQNQELYQIIQASEIVYDKSMKIYLTAMAVRLFEMRRILKPTGSIYLHCDPTASHYLKLVIDSLFEKGNFRNEIVWCYTQGGRPKKDFPRKHEVILRCTKSAKYVFNGDAIKVEYQLYSDKSSDSFTKVDEDGRYYKEVFGSTRKKKYRYYKDEGKVPYDWWIIPKLTGRTAAARKEYTGYPTQKPLALLERIIKASSNEGDMVLDPFCGCATACVAAERLNRQWVGIDVSPSAEDITKLRLEEASEQGLLFSPIRMSDVIVTCEPPARTDPQTSKQIVIADLFLRPPSTQPSQTELQEFHSKKHLLYGNQEGKCNLCKHPFPYRNMTIDHIIPRVETDSVPDDRLENLQILCAACNSTKGPRSQEYAIRRLQEIGVLR